MIEAIARLETFAKENESADLYKEFLVRGVSRKSATTVVTVIPEARLKVYAKKLESFSQSLFSVSKQRSRHETLHYKLEKPQVMNLTIDCGSRPAVVHIIPEARPAMEKEKKNKSMFAMPGTSKKPSAEAKKPSPEVKKPVATITPVEKTPQKGGASPEKAKGSATKTSAEKSNVKGKQPTKIQMGKGSIASFFGQKPAAAASEAKNASPTEKVTVKKESPKSAPAEQIEQVEEKKQKPIKEKEVKKERESPKAPPPKSSKSKETPAADDSSRKRNLSSDRGSGSDKNKKKSPEEPSSKKAKKETKTKKVEKRSRIMAICDSDSSGDEATTAKPRPETDEEDAVEVKPSKKATKGDSADTTRKTSPDENRNPATKKRKAFRKVTKSYQDEDGFISEELQQLFEKFNFNAFVF